MPSNLYKRGKVWWGRLSIGGKERRRSLRTASKAEARKWLDEWKAEVQRARHYGHARMTWEAAVVRYCRDVMVAGVKPSTQKRYLVSFRAVQEALDGKYIDEIGRREIAAVVARRREAKATNATIRRDLTAISRVFASAISWGVCEHNPALEYDRQVIRERRDPIVLPSAKAVAAAVAAAPGAMSFIIALAAQTGLRQAELLTLGWRQVDLERRTLMLDRTKTDRPRVVPLSSAALATFARFPRGDAGLVFCHSGGQAYRNFPSQFKAWRDRNNVRFRFHDLRHYFAVHYLQQGGNIYDLQRILGHSSIKTTELYLAYLSPEDRAVSTSGPAQNLAQV